MAIKLNLLTGQSGDYTPIASNITQNDGLAFDAIYQKLIGYCANNNQFVNGRLTEDKATIAYLISQNITINCLDLSLNIAAISTLKAVGVIQTNDNVHIGLTPLGYGFYQFIQV